MNKTLTLSLVILTSIQIASASVDYQKKYEEQVYNNQRLVEYCQEQDKTISDQKHALEIQKIKEQERLLLYIPFTQIGLSKDATIGFIVGYGLCLIL